MKKDKRDRDKCVVKALNEATAVMQRMEDTGDIDGFAVITQRPELGPVSQPDTGVSIATKVMHGLGDVWKARYQKPGARSWKCVAVLPWRENCEDAEDDLEVYAEAHGMKKVEE